MNNDELTKFIEKFIYRLPAERRLYPDLYAGDLADAILQMTLTYRAVTGNTFPESTARIVSKTDEGAAALAQAARILGLTVDTDSNT